MSHFLRFRDGKCFQASQNGKRRTFSLVSGAKIRNSTIIPDQCKATLDVAGNNVGWIPFAQNADTIEKAIAANKLLSCTLLQKFAFLHLQIKLFSTDAPKKMLLFKGHLSQHTYDFSAALYYEKLASSTATTVVFFFGRL